MKDLFAKVNELCGIKESDTGLAMPHLWDVTADKQVSLMKTHYQRLEVPYSKD